MDTKVVEDGKQIEDEPKKKGMALIIHDFKQKPLIPVKILFFVMFSSKFECTIYLVSKFIITAIIKRYRSIGTLFNYSHEVARNNGRRDCHHLRYCTSVWSHRSIHDGNGR